MSSIDTLISNARSYADAAVSGALAQIEKLSDVKNLIDELLFVKNTPQWNYTRISDAVFSALNTITSQQPPKPTKLGEFEVDQPPSFEPIDKQAITHKIAELINIIQNLPSRMEQAVALFDVLNQKITADLNNGSYGIEERDETNLWNRARDRESIAANLAVEEIKKQYAALGIPVPQGAMNESIRIALAKAQDQMSTINRDISIKRADLYRQAREFTITKAIELAVAQFKDLTDIKISAMKSAIEAELGLINSEVESHKEELAVYGYSLERMLKMQGVYADIYKTDITGWAARLEALTRAYGVMQQANTDQWNADKLVMSESIERAKAQIAAFTEQTNIRLAVMREIANIYAHKVSGALASLNTLAAQIEEIQTD